MAADKTLLLLYPGCIAYEMMLAAELLAEHAPLVVATPDGADHLATSGLTIAADLSFARVHPTDYRVVLVPGGDCESVLDDADLAALLRGALDSGAVVAAICAAPLLLASAGLLRGKRFTHGFKSWHRAFLAPYWTGATFVDEIVVRDGTLVTAMAEGHVDLAVELLALLDLGDPERRESKRAFYKGVVQPALPPPDQQP